jgi:enoyl-CoA hydratase/carnithine racemase|tara:strand:+ start:87 stop:839 length:753 start_codon:yes stop_codon:yes gene_type:complete
MTNFSEIKVSRDGERCTISFNRTEALNAITPTMLEELNTAATAASEDDSIRFVVLTGEGKSFSAGVDLKALGERELVNGKVGDILDLPARRLTSTLSSMPKVTIARVNGFCFTGALELAISCDLLVVASNAKMGDTHAKFGLRPTWGLSQRLPELVGLAKARELSFTARMFSGEEAAQWGLATEAVALEDLDRRIDDLIAEMSANSSESFVAYKDLYAASSQLGLKAGLEFEAITDYRFSETEERLKGFR